MKYRFVLGVGRGGTTFLGRLMALSSSPMKFLEEPLQLVEKSKYGADALLPFIDPINDIESIEYLKRLLFELSQSNEMFNDHNRNISVKRCDEDYNYLLTKEVHALLAFPHILKGMDYKVVVITRDTSRVIDSYFYGHKKNQRKYLIEEYGYVREYVRSKKKGQNELIDLALERTSQKIIRYIKRPHFLTNEVIRQVCITEIMKNYLIEWSNKDTRLMHVSFEDLCKNSIENCMKLYRHFDFKFDNSTIEKIISMTSGDDINYYSTSKNSIEILNQKYKYLDKTQLRKMQKLLDMN